MDAVSPIKAASLDFSVGWGVSLLQDLRACQELDIARAVVSCLILRLVSGARPPNARPWPKICDMAFRYAPLLRKQTVSPGGCGRVGGQVGALCSSLDDNITDNTARDKSPTTRSTPRGTWFTIRGQDVGNYSRVDACLVAQGDKAYLANEGAQQFVSWYLQHSE